MGNGVHVTQMKMQALQTLKVLRLRCRIGETLVEPEHDTDLGVAIRDLPLLQVLHRLLPAS